MDKDLYFHLLAGARRSTLRNADSEDLLHDALVIALQKDRADLSKEKNRRWLTGVLRNRSLFEARSAARRRQREQDFSQMCEGGIESAPAIDPELPLGRLPAALRTTALLIATGHTKQEIKWLLKLSDAAFRRRLSDVRRKVSRLDTAGSSGPVGLEADLQYGRLRRDLLRLIQAPGVELASHDADGHLFVIRSQNPGARQL